MNYWSGNKKTAAYSLQNLCGSNHRGNELIKLQFHQNIKHMHEYILKYLIQIFITDNETLDVTFLITCMYSKGASNQTFLGVLIRLPGYHFAYHRIYRSSYSSVNVDPSYTTYMDMIQTQCVSSICLTYMNLNAFFSLDGDFFWKSIIMIMTSEQSQNNKWL